MMVYSAPTRESLGVLGQLVHVDHVRKATQLVDHAERAPTLLPPLQGEQEVGGDTEVHDVLDGRLEDLDHFPESAATNGKLRSNHRSSENSDHHRDHPASRDAYRPVR